MIYSLKDATKMVERYDFGVGHVIQINGLYRWSLMSGGEWEVGHGYRRSLNGAIRAMREAAKPWMGWFGGAE